MKQRSVYIGGLALVSATMLSNVVNLVFNVYLGRSISLQDFGELSLFTSLLYLISIPLGSFSATSAHTVAKLYGKYSKNHAQAYFRFLFRKTFMYGVIVSAVWAAASVYLSRFFHTESPLHMLMFSPLWFVSVVSANASGYLKGTLAFGKIAALSVIESVSRLAVAFLLVYLGLAQYAVVSIIISFILAGILGWIFTRDADEHELADADKEFNIRFFLSSTVNGISIIAFLTLDVVLVKHFLSATAAGEYGLLSLVGKMTYFLGSLFAPFMLPIVSHNEGAKKDSKKTFYFLFAITLAFSVCSFVGLGVFGWFFVPMIFGAKITAVIPLLLPYVLSMALLTITQPIVSYFQAKGNHLFSIVGFFVAMLQITLTVLFHQDLTQIVYVMLVSSSTNLVIMSILYLLSDRLQETYTNSKHAFRRMSYES